MFIRECEYYWKWKQIEFIVHLHGHTKEFGQMMAFLEKPFLMVDNDDLVFKT